MHNVRQVVQPLNLLSAQPDAKVIDVAVAMSEGGVGAIPIIEGERLVGIFSERDLMTRVVVSGRDAHEIRVEEVMTHKVLTAGPDESVECCLEKMQRAGCRHLPVVQDGRVIAMLLMRDLLKDEIDEQDDEIRQLRAYIHQTPVA